MVCVQWREMELETLTWVTDVRKLQWIGDHVVAE